MIKKNEIYLALLIIILALLVRLPGIFWGYHVFGNENIGFNTAEAPIATMADEFLSIFKGEFKKPIYKSYVKGLSFQVSLLAFPLTFFMKVSLPILVGLARGISLIYGLLIIILVFFISLKIFKIKKIAFLSSLFLALTGLCVAYSHIGKPDSGIVFWIYFVFFFSYMYIKDKKNIYIILASIGTGFAVGSKFAVIQIIPLIYIFFKSKGKKNKIINLLLIIFITAGSFALINGFSYTPDDLLEMLNGFSEDFGSREYNKLLNIPIYISNLFTGIGLFVFLFSLYGFILILKNKIINKDIFFIFILPLLLHFIQFCNSVYTAPRYIIPLIPLLVIIAAYGFYNLNLKLTKKIFTTLLIFIIIYQLIYIISSEINYIYDTREKMGKWMLKNIDLNSKIYIGDSGNKYLTEEYFTVTNKSKISQNKAVNRQGVVIPSEFKTVANFKDADYIVITGSIIYLRSSWNPLKDPVCCKEVFHCHYEECIFTQNLFRNKLPYKLIKKIEIYAFTPELWLYKKVFGTYRNGIEDIFLFKKKIN